MADLTTTASGLQYEVLKAGEGTEHPKPTDTVQVHYEGRLTDGTVFDSSYKRGAIRFRLNEVIPGWTEGVQLMTEGAKYRFTIPGDLAYGKRGIPGTIPPDATLIFDVELIGINW